MRATSNGLPICAKARPSREPDRSAVSLASLGYALWVTRDEARVVTGAASNKPLLPKTSCAQPWRCARDGFQVELRPLMRNRPDLRTPGAEIFCRLITNLRGDRARCPVTCCKA